MLHNKYAQYSITSRVKLSDTEGSVVLISAMGSFDTFVLDV